MNNYFKNEKIIICDDTKEQCKGYENYLKSKHWIKFRTKILKNIKYCSLCNEKKRFYHLHHLSYKNLGNEKPEDVLVLCNECHKLSHKFNEDLVGIKNEYKIEGRKKNKKCTGKCNKCKHYTFIKIKSSKFIKVPYCKYKGITNPENKT